MGKKDLKVTNSNSTKTYLVLLVLDCGKRLFLFFVLFCFFFCFFFVLLCFVCSLFVFCFAVVAGSTFKLVSSITIVLLLYKFAD